MENLKILFFSGSLGLGHVVRDLAIASELRKQIPGAQISWLASHPANMLLKEAGEKLLPEAELIANVNNPAERAAGVYKLNLMKYLAKSRSEWSKNVKVFKQVISKEKYDLIIGDETYEIVVAMQDKKLQIDVPFVMIYDFLGLDSMSWSPFEKLYTYMWNKVWSGVKIFADKKNMALFVGEPEDIPDTGFGFRLPQRREYAKAYYNFIGYVFPFNPADYEKKNAVRKKLRYGKEPLVICSIGGTNIGKDLLELCGQSFPILRKTMPDLRMILVCGPRLSPESLNVPKEVEVKGYVPALFEHFAASDIVILQAGGTSTLELTALRRPFIYFPLEDHSEQEINVAERLRRHRAGTGMTYSKTSPEELAEQVISSLNREVKYSRIPTDGAQRATSKIKQFLSLQG
jgi:UDP-N-acetylglucosamine:LPS N-acetylglucosamine transferase